MKVGSCFILLMVFSQSHTPPVVQPQLKFAALRMRHSMAFSDQFRFGEFEGATPYLLCADHCAATVDETVKNIVVDGRG